MAELSGRDSELFRSRGNLLTTNANLYIANNNNPFLVSPYAPPTVAATKSAIGNLSTIVSTQAGILSTFLNPTTFTLSISTIQPMPADINQTLTLHASTINIDGAPGASFNVSMDANFGNVVANQLQVNTLLTTSSLAVPGDIQCSTVTGSTITTDQLTVTSLLTTSSLAVPGDIQYSTMSGSTITVNDITVQSTLSISTMTATGPIQFATLNGGTITASSLLTPNYVSTNQLVFSSLMMQPTAISTVTQSTFYSSIILNIEGINYYVPIFPV